MKFKRMLCTLLTAAIVCTMLFSVPAAADSPVIKISNSSPCITADVGQKITLSNYSVVFDDDYLPSYNVAWKDAGGNAITEFTPSAKGVTPLTAAANGKTKTIYVVAKEASESEYVLFELDFSKYTGISQLKELGFTTNKDDGLYVFQNGQLLLGNDSTTTTQLVLPAWLADFGDYSVTTEAKLHTVSANNPWFGLMVRAQNGNGKQYPNYHFRLLAKDNAISFEFSEKTIESTWNVIQNVKDTDDFQRDAYHTYNIRAFENEMQCNLDGAEIACATKATVDITLPDWSTGLIGLTMNQGTMAVKNIRVTLQTEEPRHTDKASVLLNNLHEGNHLRNPIANVQSVTGDINAQLNNTQKVGVALFKASEAGDMAQIFKTCREKGIIPTVHITTTAEADKLLAASESTELKDINVISEKSEVLSYIRKKNVWIRTGLAVDLKTSTLDSKAANELRKQVRSAPATFCVVKSANASRQVVAELQELAVAVWVQVDAQPGTDAYIIEAAKAITSGANGIISGDANALTDVINSNFSQHSMSRTPIMIAHRGNPSQAPENTLSGFLTAYKNGCDIFELDVEITSDGEAIIMHDNTIKRTTNYTGTKKVSEMTLAEVQEYYILGSGGAVTSEKVPTLRQVLEAFKDKDCRIFVELKGKHADNAVIAAKIIKETGMEDRVDIISSSKTYLTQTQKDLPGMSTSLLYTPNLDGKTYSDAVVTLASVLDEIQKVNSTIGLNKSDVSLHFEQAATDRGITVWPYTYNASSSNTGFLSGYDGLTTDTVEWSKDMAKFIQADVSEVSLEGNAAAQITVSAATYGHAVNAISSEKLIVSVLTGKDLVRVENGKLVANPCDGGTATVIFGYPTTTKSGGEYVLYTQPITVHVARTEMPATEPSTVPAVTSAPTAPTAPTGVTVPTDTMPATDGTMPTGTGAPATDAIDMPDDPAKSKEKKGIDGGAIALIVVAVVAVGAAGVYVFVFAKRKNKK